jgi:hypothetical protein
MPKKMKNETKVYNVNLCKVYIKKCVLNEFLLIFFII